MWLSHSPLFSSRPSSRASKILYQRHGDLGTSCIPLPPSCVGWSGRSSQGEHKEYIFSHELGYRLCIAPDVGECTLAALFFHSTGDTKRHQVVNSNHESFKNLRNPWISPAEKSKSRLHLLVQPSSLFWAHPRCVSWYVDCVRMEEDRRDFTMSLSADTRAFL